MIKRFENYFGFNKTSLVWIVLGSLIMSFSLVNIHMQANVTEGGVLGLTLFLYKMFGLKPSIISPILDIVCVLIAISLLGKKFLRKTILTSLIFAVSYKFFLNFGPTIPSLYDTPFLASILGGIGIGIGCGMVISQGGAAGGDDALAMVISKQAKISISKAYLFTDLSILALSLSYIPITRIVFSLLTTIISSFLIGQFEVEVTLPKPTSSLKNI